MLPLIFSILGSLVALGGLVMLLPQIQAQQLSGASIGAWIFRAGILVLLAGETVALFRRPEAIVLKTILILTAATTLVCLAVFLREWPQPGFGLERSFSWGAVVLGMATYFTAIMFIQAVAMLFIMVAAFLSAREFHRRVKAGQFEYGALKNLVIAIQATIVVLTLVFLIL